VTSGRKEQNPRSQCPTPLLLLLSLAQFVESIAQRRKKHAHARSSSRSQGPNPTAATYTKRMPNLINSLPDECLAGNIWILAKSPGSLCLCSCFYALAFAAELHASP